MTNERTSQFFGVNRDNFVWSTEYN